MSANHRQFHMLLKKIAGREAAFGLEIAVALLVKFILLGGIWWLFFAGQKLTVDNYSNYPLLKLAPVLAIGGSWLVVLLSLKRYVGTAFLLSSLVVIGTIITAGGSMFPFIIPSSIAPSSSLTVWDASASRYTLQLLFFAAVLLMPLVMAYTAWVYRVLRGKVTVEDIRKNENVMY